MIFKTKADKSLSEKANPIAIIRSEGLLMGDSLKTASLKALQDVSKIYALSITYRLTNQKKYLRKTTEFLLAWAEINKGNGNPINETKLEDAIVGYDFIRNKIKKKDRILIDNWFRTISDAEVNSKYAETGKGTAHNNWNSHRIKIIVLITYTLHDKNYDDFINSALKTQISKNLNPDGSSIDFEHRDALHYHIYDLEPLLQAAITIKRATGKDYYHYQSKEGASIKKSVEFLVPFVSGEKKHIEFENSNVPFDKARAANNEKGYQPANFVASTGIYALSLAAYFDTKYLKVI